MEQVLLTTCCNLQNSLIYVASDFRVLDKDLSMHVPLHRSFKFNIANVAGVLVMPNSIQISTISWHKHRWNKS